MNNVNLKYLKDESDKVISPVTSADSVFVGGGKLIDYIYPIGSIYMSVNSTSPQILFGGTWETFAEGRTLVSVAENEYNFREAELYGGEATHTLTTSEMPEHTHSFTGTGHTHTLNNHTHSFSATTGSSGAHTHTGKTKSNASGTGTNNYVRGWNYSAEETELLTNSAGSHKHSVSGTTGKNSSNTSSTTATGTNSKVGGGTAHNNMPPYMTVYMWKRTA